MNLKTFIRLVSFASLVFTFMVFQQAVAGEKNATSLDVVKVVSPGGIEAWLVSDHINPIINVRFAFKGGASLDPVGKEGLASMASSLIDEGAEDLDSQSFQRLLEIGRAHV